MSILANMWNSYSELGSTLNSEVALAINNITGLNDSLVVTILSTFMVVGGLAYVLTYFTNSFSQIKTAILLTFVSVFIGYNSRMLTGVINEDIITVASSVGSIGFVLVFIDFIGGLFLNGFFSNISQNSKN